MFVRDGLAAAAEPFDPAPNRGLGDGSQGHGSEDGVDVPDDIGAVTRQGGRLHAGQVVDVGVQPLGDCRDVVTDLIELDEAQCLIGTVVLQQCLETLRGR